MGKEAYKNILKPKGGEILKNFRGGSISTGVSRGESLEQTTLPLKLPQEK